MLLGNPNAQIDNLLKKTEPSSDFLNCKNPLQLSIFYVSFLKQTNTVQGVVVLIWADLTRTLEAVVLVVATAQVGIPGRPLKINGDPVGQTGEAPKGTGTRQI